MSKLKLDIRPLAGLGDLSFGVSMSEVVEVLGQPEDSEVLSDGEDEVETLIWNYWKHGLSLFIEGNENSVLSNFETDNPEATLYGRKIFDLDQQQIIDLMATNGFKDYEEEQETWGENRLSFEDAQIDFYFDKGALVTVNWGIVVNNQGEIL